MEAGSNLNFSKNANIVLNKRYLKKNNKGEVVETPAQMVERVSSYIGSIDKKYSADKKSVENGLVRIVQSQTTNLLKDTRWDIEILGKVLEENAPEWANGVMMKSLFGPIVIQSDCYGTPDYNQDSYAIESLSITYVKTENITGGK